jgi:mRNA (guanine-N7-)-methyltransferase
VCISFTTLEDSLFVVLRLGTRADSHLYHMRAFNGWVKATQIQELDPKTIKNRDGPMRVLDLACGKGGDLGKWILHPRGVSNYVGIDVARGSLKDAAIRARNMKNKLKKCTFTCADLGADVCGRIKSAKHKNMQKLSSWSLQNEPRNNSGDPLFKMVRGGGISLEDKFDVVSVQVSLEDGTSFSWKAWLTSFC